MPNNPLRKDINKPYIIKEEEEKIEDINKELKEPINKINISDNINELSNIDLHNPDYLKQINEEIKNNFIPKLIVKKSEINPIETSIELDREINKYDIVEKPKELKEIKINKYYCDKKLYHKIIGI